MFLLVISVFGLIFRLLRVCFRSFSKAMLMRKSHGRHFNGVRISSSEAFVLELVLDNLGKTPTFATKVIRDVAARLKEQNLKDSKSSLDFAQTPLTKSNDIRIHDALYVKPVHDPSGDFQPIHGRKSFYFENSQQCNNTSNLMNFSENPQHESKSESLTKDISEPIYSDINSQSKSGPDESSKLSKKERKKLKKEARKLANTLEPLSKVKEDVKEKAAEVLVKTEEPSFEPFPQLLRPSDSSVASFPNIQKSEREWL